MNEHRIKKRCVFLLLTVVLIMNVSDVICRNNEAFNFDTLFPSNAYSRATDQCVKVWGAWDKLLRSKLHTSVDIIRILDCSLGQLILASAYLKQISEGEKPPLAEQLHYISRVIGTLANRFAQLPPMDVARYACLEAQITQLRALIEEKMKE